MPDNTAIDNDPIADFIKYAQNGMSPGEGEQELRALINSEKQELLERLMELDTDFGGNLRVRLDDELKTLRGGK